MAYRKPTGRPIRVQNSKVGLPTARDLIRKHLRQEGRMVKDLAKAWNVVPVSAYRIMYTPSRPLSPQYVDAVIDMLRLDDFDATQLRLRAANEAGWNINPEFLNL